MKLHLLSGGAAQGLVGALEAPFRAASGCEIAPIFGAVGAMRDKLMAGTPADLLILTKAMIAELAVSGHLIAESAADIGVVRTAIAVRDGDPPPETGDEAGLRSALLEADAIYFPDPRKATAGIHFAKVLGELGIARNVAMRLRPYPNGATAMLALSQSQAERPIGCTQVTEILHTPGVILVGPLPQRFELATVYTAGVGARAALPAEARQLATLLSGERGRSAREQAGFEPPA